MNLKGKSIEKIYNKALVRGPRTRKKMLKSIKGKKGFASKGNFVRKSNVNKDSSITLGRKIGSIILKKKLSPKYEKKLPKKNKSEIKNISNSHSFRARFSTSPELTKLKRPKLMMSQNFLNINHRRSKESIKDVNNLSYSKFESDLNSFLKKLKKRGTSRKSKGSINSKGYKLENTLSMLVKDGDKTVGKKNDDTSERLSALKSSWSISKLKSFKFCSERGKRNLNNTCHLKNRMSENQAQIHTGEDDEGNHMVINSNASKSPLRVRGEEIDEIRRVKKIKGKNHLKFSYQGDRMIERVTTEQARMEPLTDRYEKDGIIGLEIRDIDFGTQTERVKRLTGKKIDFFGKQKRKFSMKENIASKLFTSKKKRRPVSKGIGFNSPNSMFKNKRRLRAVDSKKFKIKKNGEKNKKNIASYEKDIESFNDTIEQDFITVFDVDEIKLNEKSIKELLEQSRKVSP